MDPRGRGAGQGRTVRRHHRARLPHPVADPAPGPRLNYGLNKVRFPNPVKVGARIRAAAQIAEVSDVPAGKQMVTRYTIEIEGEDKPACVAETVVLLLG